MKNGKSNNSSFHLSFYVTAMFLTVIIVATAYLLAR
jgi:hypothetical protein